ncbi:MAG: beta-glucosidase [Flavobacteriales bacterium]|jgi:beta-glucosidase
MKFKYLLLPLLAVICISCGPRPVSTSVNDQNPSVQNPHLAKRLASVDSEVERLLAELTMDEKLSLIHANGKFSVAAVERLGIHEMWMSDGPHGVRHEIQRHSWAGANWEDDNSTWLPPLTAVAASWNPEMAKLHGNVLGSEARHRRKDFILGPGVNLARLPLYGRNFEYMGEDPYLASRLAVSEIKAIQANDVAATIKHYALNTQELNRTGVNAKPDARTLREVYLPAFEAAVKEAGVLAIMGSYNEVYGTNANQSKLLVKDILKGEWGYKGVLLTDWNVDINSHDAGLYGLDIEMGSEAPSYDEYHLGNGFKKLILDGTIPEAELDDKVRRVLYVQLTMGMMDKYRMSGQRNVAQHHQDARTIASEGIVLLKNDENILPLDKSTLKNILVMGPNAQRQHARGGGSSEVPALYEVTPLEGLRNKLGDDVNITVLRARSNAGLLPIAADYVASRHWTGTPAWNMDRYSDAAKTQAIENLPVPDSAYTAKGGANDHLRMTASIRPLQDGVHTLQASVLGQFSLKVDGKEIFKLNSTNDALIEKDLTLKAGQQYNFEIEYDGSKAFTLGWNAPGNLYSAEAEYLAAAKAADVVIYFGGLSHGDDREAIDRPDMKLPDFQDAVIDKLIETNPNTIVMLVAGSAVELPWFDKVKGLLWGWYAGMEGGNAFADALFGDINPGGKMPITLPRKLEDTAPIALDDYNATESLYKEGVFIGYRWFEQQGIEPMVPFGFGLSYTSFSYSDLRLSSTTLSGSDDLSVTVKVTNTGKVAGAEIVQLYLGDAEASVARPAKELKGFGKVYLKPGESKDVQMTLITRDLSFWDEKGNDWLAESGEFNVMIGASVADIRLQASFDYQR